MFERVIVGVRDDEAGRDAIALAEQLVARDGRLALAHVLVVTSRPAPDSGAAVRAVESRQATERLTALGRELGVDAAFECVEARSVSQGLHELASGRQADLLVVGASRRDELLTLYIGDDTREVLEGAPCAVAVAPVGYSARSAAMRRIGVAYDGSVASRRALSLGRKLATEWGAQLSACEVVPDTIYARDPWNVDGEIDERVDEARRRLSDLGGLEPEASSGDPVEELFRYAQTVDLLVMGSHRHSPIQRFMEESTAQQLADGVPCPLLTSAAAAAA